MIHVNECPVCKCNTFDPVFDCKDYSITNEIFTIKRCTNCLLLLTSPRPEQDQYYKYYQSEKYISHSDTDKGLINKIYHVIRKITLKSKTNIIKKYISLPNLLDIGSGAGYFLNYCKKQEFTVKGVEPDLDTRERSIQQFGLEVYEENALNTFSENSFDVITLWHVLEHIDNLEMRFHQMHRLLKENGILIIAVPNPSSFDAKYYERYWAGYDVPRHLWHFSPDNIMTLTAQYNFKVIKIFPMIFDAYYVSMLSEKYKGNSFHFLRGLIRGFLSNLNAAFSKSNQYSSQIYLIKKVN